MQLSKGGFLGWQVGEEPEDMPGVRPRPQGAGGEGDRGGHRGGYRGGPGGRGRLLPFPSTRSMATA